MMSNQLSLFGEERTAKKRGKMDVHYSSATPEWYTPAHIIERAIKVLGAIDLDPCSNGQGMAANVQAARHFTIQDDGLRQRWNGRVWMNPPYGRKVIDRWTSKLHSEYQAGHVTAALALVPARPDTNWWAGLAIYPVCFIKGRLRFSNAKSGAPFASAVVYLGSDLARFRSVFGEIGHVYTPSEGEQ